MEVIVSFLVECFVWWFSIDTHCALLLFCETVTHTSRRSDSTCCDSSPHQTHTHTHAAPWTDCLKQTPVCGCIFGFVFGCKDKLCSFIVKVTLLQAAVSSLLFQDCIAVCRSISQLNRKRMEWLCRIYKPVWLCIFCYLLVYYRTVKMLSTNKVKCPIYTSPAYIYR